MIVSPKDLMDKLDKNKRASYGHARKISFGGWEDARSTKHEFEFQLNGGLGVLHIENFARTLCH